jgi:ribonuclease HII
VSPLKKTPFLQKGPHSPSSWLEDSPPFLGETHIAGVDEVGRGPLAGPVVAAACLFTGPVDIQATVRDSKKLSPQKRAFVVSELEMHPHVHVAFGEVSPQEIDQINIHEATLKAMALAIESLPVSPQLVFVDGVHFPPISFPGITLKKGDSRSLQIALASIFAKERRDAMMRAYHEQYPDYGFAKHMGYGTQEHLKALKRVGPCPIHRQSFGPVAQAALSFLKHLKK